MKGDLTSGITFNSKDEIGALALDYNTFLETLRKLILKVYDSSNNAKNVSFNLSSSIEQMDSSIKSVAGTTEGKMGIIDKLSKMAEDGEKEMTVTIDVIKEITGTVKKVVENIDKSSKSSTKTGMEEVSYGVSEIFRSAQLVTEVGTENSESVKQIEENLSKFKVTR